MGGETRPLRCASTAFAAKIPPLPCVSTAFVYNTPPLPCVSTDFATLPLPCVSTDSATLPFRTARARRCRRRDAPPDTRREASVQAAAVLRQPALHRAAAAASARQQALRKASRARAGKTPCVFHCLCPVPCMFPLPQHRHDCLCLACTHCMCGSSTQALTACVAKSVPVPCGAAARCRQGCRVRPRRNRFAVRPGHCLSVVHPPPSFVKTAPHLAVLLLRCEGQQARQPWDRGGGPAGRRGGGGRDFAGLLHSAGGGGGGGGGGECLIVQQQKWTILSCNSPNHLGL